MAVPVGRGSASLPTCPVAGDGFRAYLERLAAATAGNLAPARANLSPASSVSQVRSGVVRERPPCGTSAVAAPGLGVSLAQGAASHSASAATWLQSLAARVARDGGDTSPTSAQWALTTERSAAPLVGLSAATAPDNDPVYVVVMTGRFVASSASFPPGASAPSGTCIAFTVDATSHVIRDYGIGPRSVDTSSVRQWHPLTL